MISLETPQRKWASSPLMGEHPGFSRVAAGALDLRWGPKEPALVASGKAVPMRVARGPLGIPLGPCWGLRPCVEKVPEPEDSSLVLTWILGYFWSLPRGVSPRFEWGHSRALSSRSSSSVTLPFTWIKGSGSFPRGFPTRLSHEAFPQGCPTCHRGVSRSSA